MIRCQRFNKILKDVRLFSFKSDKNLHVRIMAAEALRNITRKDFSEDIDKWQKWWEKNEESFQKSR